MRYIALGDSISIDDYPDQERGSAGFGAASLFADRLLAHKLVDEWSYYPRDGAEIRDIRAQMERAKRCCIPAHVKVISITAGGNDISFKCMQMKDPRPYGNEFNEILNTINFYYTNLVLAVRREFPNAQLLLNTLYDPTDGTETLPANCGLWAEIAPMYSVGRRSLGKYIKAWGNRVPFVTVCDIFTLFDGKGMKIQNAEGYYYDPFLIEPGAVGAEKIAELWFDKYVSSLAGKPEEKQNDRSHQASEGIAGVRDVR